MRWTSAIVVIAVALGLAACGTTEAPRSTGVPGYKIGNPYQVNGVWYYPSEDFNYDETGIASWYGPGFHGGTTANGEPYDMNAETAAHKTLPMPSLVEVTNLENGRRIQVRINDRGPFVPGRIIDLSRKSAEDLGMQRAGTARVRVRILSEQSLAMKMEALGQSPVQVASASPSTPVARADLAPPPAPVAMAAEPSGTSSSVGAPVHPGAPPASAPPSEPTVPPVTVVPVKPTNIYIQAGAFSQERNAEKLRNELARLGRAQVMVADVRGKQYYRVRLGPVGSVEEGDRLLAHVISTGHGDARIVID
ncbi:MAG: septal ring lytic transglycosylase RlpA family protein [Candidatus Eiseniibacteriota bacterium]